MKTKNTTVRLIGQLPPPTMMATESNTIITEYRMVKTLTHMSCVGESLRKQTIIKAITGPKTITAHHSELKNEIR